MALANIPPINGPVPQDSIEVLQCFVQQPCEERYTTNGDTFDEVWKGPYKECLYIDNGLNVYGTHIVMGAVRPSFPERTFIKRFNPPGLPSGYVWVVAGVKVDEQTPGDHCLLTITYQAFKETALPTSGGSWDEDRETWDLEWVAEQKSVLVYCKNTEDAGESGCEFKKNIRPNTEDESFNPNAPFGDSPGEYAHSDVVKMYAESRKQRAMNAVGQNEFIFNGGIYEMNEHCRNVAKYYTQNVNPQFWHPVLTRTRVNNRLKNPDYFERVGKDINCVVDLPDECPYQFEEAADGEQWKWLYCGPRMSRQRVGENYQFTIVETWIGQVHWSADFYQGGDLPKYGDGDAWKIGEY